MDSAHFKKLYVTIVCCLSEDSHLIRDAVLLKCGGHACAKCSHTLSTCKHCHACHNTKKESNPINMKSTIELLIESNYSAIIQHLKTQYLNKKHELTRGRAIVVALVVRLLIPFLVWFFSNLN